MSHDGKAQQRGRRRRNVNLGTTEDDERSGRDGVASVAASKPEFPKEYLSSWPQGWGGKRPTLHPDWAKRIIDLFELHDCRGQVRALGKEPASKAAECQVTSAR